MVCCSTNTIPVVREWSGWTTAHGIPHIAASPNKLWRIFWTIVTLIALGLLIYFLVMLFIKYFSFPSNLKFEKTKFPSVTMCHLNPYYRSKAVGAPAVGASAAVTPDAAIGGTLGSAIDLTNLEDAYLHSRHNIWRADNAQQMGNVIEALGIKGGESEEQKVNTQAKRWIEYVQYQLNEDDKFDYVGYNADDLILGCTYNVKPCYATDFKKRFHPTYGNCYTFNIEGAFFVERAGAPYGLQLLLRTDHADYSKISDISGFRVAVHKPDTEPFIDTQGTYAAPGFTTAMALSFLQTERQPWPWGDCDDDFTGKTHYYSGAYSVEGCQRSCLQDEIVSKCGCFEPTLVPIKDKSPCSKGDSPQAIIANMNCVNDAIEKFSVIDGCSCPPPCSVSIYDVTTSISKWPSGSYVPSDCHNNTLKRRYWQNDEDWSSSLEGVRNADSSFTAQAGTDFYDNAAAPATNEGKCQQWLSSNSLRIEVYMERMNYQVIQQDKAYGVVNLISDCGGQLGLFLGFSLVTIIEVLTLIFLVCCGCNCLMETEQDKPKKPKPPPPSPPPSRGPPPPRQRTPSPPPENFDNVRQKPRLQRRGDVAPCNKWRSLKNQIGPAPNKTDIYSDWVFARAPGQQGPGYPPPPV